MTMDNALQWVASQWVLSWVIIFTLVMWPSRPTLASDLYCQSNLLVKGFKVAKIDQMADRDMIGQDG